MSRMSHPSLVLSRGGPCTSQHLPTFPHLLLCVTVVVVVEGGTPLPDLCPAWCKNGLRVAGGGGRGPPPRADRPPFF